MPVGAMHFAIAGKPVCKRRYFTGGKTPFFDLPPSIGMGIKSLGEAPAGLWQASNSTHYI
jgi:hypothetical protein